MAIRTTQGNGLDNRRLANFSEPEVYYTDPIDTNVYVRNSAWLALPTVLSTEQKFVGLLAVYRNSNFLALSATGDYTVNWGDGTTENFSSGAIAYHEYSWDDVDISATTQGTVSFSGTTDQVTRTNHGYNVGSPISFAEIPESITELKPNRQYYVFNATTGTFQLSEDNVTAINFSSFGTGYILPYKQVIVTITPQAGQDLTSLNFNIKHNQTNLTNYTTGWLDMVISGSTLTSLTISSTVQNVKHNNLVRASLISPNQIQSFTGTFFNCNELKTIDTWYVSTATTATVNCSNMFRNCFSLKSVSLFDTSKVTDSSFMFANCASLQTIPNFNMQAVTTTNSMFLNATSIKSIPPLNTQNSTDMGNMFNGCTNLQYVPLLNTSSCTNMASMFQSCFSLQSIPVLDTKLVTSMSSMFQNCYSLKKLLLLDTGAVTNMTSMFSGCHGLEEVPLLNTSNCITMTGMFQNCYKLSTVPQFDLSNVTNASSMFSGCYNLNLLPIFSFTDCTNLSGAFLNCVSLQDITLTNVGSVTTFANTFQNCYSLQRISFNIQSATPNSMSSMFRNCNSLQTLPSNLVTTYVTDMSNAFNGCSSLSKVPSITVTSCTNMNSMFAGCYGLSEAPYMETTATTTMNAMFQNCHSIKTVPRYNTSAVTDITNMFQSCFSLESIPALSFPALVSGGTSAFTSCSNLSSFSATSVYQALTLSNAKLSKSKLEQVFASLPVINTSRALVVTGNYGVDVATTLTGTLTAGSTTITMASTAGITTGSYVSGTGITSGVTVSFQDTGDTVTLNNHGFPNGTYVTFTSITGTTGIGTYTPYYVVNTAANTFQLSDTSGGAAKPLTTNGTGTISYVTTVTSITPNTSISVSIPASASGTNSLTFRLLNTSLATYKRWALTL